MQDPERGVPIKIVNSCIIKIKSVFTDFPFRECCETSSVTDKKVFYQNHL